MLTEYHFLSFEHWLGIVCGRCIKIDFSVVWKRVQILYFFVGINSWSFDNSVLLQCRWSGPTGVLITLALSFYQVCLCNFPQIILSFFSLCTCYHTLFSPSTMQIVCSCFLQASSSGVMVFRVRELKTCICPLWGSYKVLLCGLEQILTYHSPAFNFQMYLRGTVRPSITWTKQWTTWCLRKCWSCTNKFLRVLWPIRDSNF
jgi:hypothetical protein